MQAELSQKIIAAIRQVTGEGNHVLHEPIFSGNEWTYVKDCLDSTYVSSVGKYVDRFEADLAAYTGTRHAVAVVNGTAALHIALKLAGVQSGDEVLVPALTFIATANAVTYCNATPHFTEASESTLGIDPETLSQYLRKIASIENGVCINKITGRPIRAIVPMHTFGHPSDLDGLLAVANEFHLVLIEDAAESLGSYYKGKHTGTLGLMGTLSFNGNKIITTGGGGAILTNDADLAKRAKHLTTTAKLKHPWTFEHDEIGFNYRMPNLNAALGCAQLENLQTFVDAKRNLFDLYQGAFKDIEGVQLLAELPQTNSNYWLQTLMLSRENAGLQESILTETNAAGFMTRPAWVLIPELQPYKHFPQMPLNKAAELQKRIINIPSSAHLGMAQKQ